ncbi:MAG TPA: universal stress protein [Solirubrobacteraceae bacterium]|nr:universal stress protein [Solirubrobacteraceae bacterium]
MTKVLAAITNNSVAPAVLATARGVAHLCSGTVEALHVGEADAAVAETARQAGVPLRTLAGEPVDVLARASVADEIVAIVLGAPDAARAMDPADSTALQLIAVLEKPVVLVPREGGAVQEVISRILVPLDGTAGSAAALDKLVRLAADATVEIVVAHIHEARALPAFSDHLAHEVRAWSEEFLARNCPSAPNATLELRVGEPHEHVLDILRHSGCDLVALGWLQNLAAGHGAVVRRMLADSPVPVLLIPTRRDAAASLPAAGADPGGV